MSQKTSKAISQPAEGEVWRDILGELRLLRQDLAMLLFQDDVADYENKGQIKQSYQRAIKQHPPVSE